jgi:hypothetical protein
MQNDFCEMFQRTMPLALLAQVKGLSNQTTLHLFMAI